MTPDATYTIRRLGTSDAAAYKRLRLEALQTEPDKYSMPYATELTMPDAHWLNRVQNERIASFGLYHGDEIVGITAIDASDGSKPQDAYMTQSYIRKAHRGKGLSRMLYDARLAWAKQNNIARLTVAHRRNNIASMRANQHYGFVYTHSIQRHWPDGVEDENLYYELLLR